MAIGDLPRSARKLRNPTHNWQVQQRPFCLQPICIAPVLPNETLKNATFQARIVTDPILNPLVGWWCEFYWFYVPHRALNNQLFLDMMVDPKTVLTSTYDNVVSAPFYYEGKVNKINWLKRCYIAIVTTYFRDQGEAWDLQLIGELASTKINGEPWWQSIATQAEATYGDVPLDTNADLTITAGEAMRAMEMYEHLRLNNLIDMTYDDYLRTYGVAVPPEEYTPLPELLRYTREWSYPVNTIDPLTGTPSSAISWAIGERMDKDRYFREPGFIIGLTCARPKTYTSRQTGYAAQLLSDAYAWLPAILRDDPHTSMRQQVASTDSIWQGYGGGASLTYPHWYDMRDLFIHGDQFIGGWTTPDAATSARVNAVPLPGGTLANTRYPNTTMAESFFKTPATKCFVSQDGVVKFSILGAQQDYTPRGSTMSIAL